MSVPGVINGRSSEGKARSGDCIDHFCVASLQLVGMNLFTRPFERPSMTLCH